MIDYISMVYEKTKLKEGTLCIEQFLIYLYLNNTASTKEIANYLLIPVPVATAIKKELQKCGIVEQRNGITLSELGRTYICQEMGFEGIDRQLLSSLLEDDEVYNKTIESLSEKYHTVYSNRPTVDVTVDQAKGTVETAFKRALLCLRKGFLVGKNILCVGDDDLVSVAIGLLLEYIGSKSTKTQVCVFDIDERFLNYIDSIAKSMNLPISCVKIDLKDPLPIQYANYFDTFFTDPPYTAGGISLFLSRGLSALKRTPGLDVFFSFGNKSISDTFNMQKMFSDMGLVVSEIYKDFNMYEGASLYGGLSQMIILQTTEFSGPIIDDYYSDDLYTYDFRNAQHTYICRKCKREIILNKGETIEQLKKTGCPSCGGVIFDRKGKIHRDIKTIAKKSLGTHILVDFYGCNSHYLNDLSFIKNAMLDAAIVAKASIVSEDFHMFLPYGVSGVILIQESHFTIHTWPEYQYAAVDLFTCGDNLDLRNAMLTLKDKFECDRLEFNNVVRGLLKKGMAFHN